MQCVFTYIWAKVPETWLHRDTLHRVTKVTHTMTIEEEKEFETFQRGRGKYVLPCMKPLPLVFSDYLPGKTKKRTKFTIPRLFQKVKKEAKQKQLPLHPASTRPQSLKTTEFPFLPEKVPSKDLPNKETPPKRPTTDPSESSPNSFRECAEVF